jgi:hypothetical protein
MQMIPYLSEPFVRKSSALTSAFVRALSGIRAAKANLVVGMTEQRHYVKHTPRNGCIAA